MKKWLLIFSLLFVTGSVFAQNEDDQPEGGKIQERMREYVQRKLGLSKAEAERFSPVFVRYFREFAQTHRSNKGDRLVLQQKIIDLRLRYRTEFRQIMDENKANRVYKYEDEFRQEVVRILKENRREHNPAARRNKSLLMD
jgi:hypothetical protein